MALVNGFGWIVGNRGFPHILLIAVITVIPTCIEIHCFYSEIKFHKKKLRCIRNVRKNMIAKVNNL